MQGPGSGGINIMTRCISFIFPSVLFLFFLAFGCYPVPKAPIDTFRYESRNSKHDQLYVFLPGNGDSPDAFDENGLVQAVTARGSAIDMITVDAHLGYYMEGTIFKRLKEDIIEPAKARGYKRIWLIGNSLGGFGSISYARQYPGDITGVVLLGPFLGDKKICQEIKDAGGLQSWEPGDIPDNSKEGWEKQLWKWMKDARQQQNFWHWVKNCEEENSCPSRIYLGYGKNDRFSYGQKLLAEGLPQENVFAIDGGHNWSTWKKLWNIILEEISPKRTETRVKAGLD